MTLRLTACYRQSALRRSAVLLLTLAACSEEVVFTDADRWPDGLPPPAVGDGKVIITNSGDDTISWLELDTLAPVPYRARVGRLPPEREGPHHGAALPDGSAYFIGLSNFVPGSGTGPHGAHGQGTVDGYLLKYRAADGVLLGEARVARSPGDVRITPDGTKVLQTHFDLVKILEHAESGDFAAMVSDLAIIDTETLAVTFVPVCPAGHGVAVSDDGREAYVACWGSDELAIVTLATLAVERFSVGPGEPNPLSPVYEPYAVSVSPVDGAVWVSCVRTGDLRVFDPVRRAWDETRGPVRLGGAPFFSAFTPDGATLLVPSQGNESVAFIEAATGAIVRTVALPEAACSRPHAVLVHPDGERAIVVCEGDHRAPGTVAVLAPLVAPSVQTFHEVGVYPDDAFLLVVPE